MIDTLKASKRLHEAGMPEEQAEALAGILRDAIKEDLVTNEKLEGSLAKMELRLVLWILGTSMAIGGAAVGVMVNLHQQTITMLQHWKP